MTLCYNNNIIMYYSDIKLDYYSDCEHVCVDRVVIIIPRAFLMIN